MFLRFFSLKENKSVGVACEVIYISGKMLISTPLFLPVFLILLRLLR